MVGGRWDALVFDLVQRTREKWPVSLGYLRAMQPCYALDTDRGHFSFVKRVDRLADPCHFTFVKRWLAPPRHNSEDYPMTKHDPVEFAINCIMMALGTIADLSDWYACGDELV